MPRRARDLSVDRRDWITRAADELVAAEKMPDGPLRERALKKAAQLRSAGEIMDSLMPEQPKPAAGSRSCAGKS